MRLTRIPALVAASALMLTACKGQDESAAQAEAHNPLLAHVPAETPYLFANLEPTPPEVLDAYLERFAPTLELAETLLDDIRIEVNSDGADGHGGARLAAAVMDELRGKLNRAGIESLGFSLESHKVFYGMGAFPFMRVALKDPDALREAIARVEAASGTSFPSHSANGTGYWRMTGDGGQAAIYMAILGDHFALGMFPTHAEGEFLPAFLGQSAPRDPFGGTALADLNRDKGFNGYGSGFLDLQKLAAEFLDSGSTTLGGLQGMHHYEPESLDQACVDEIKSIVAQAPRLVAGTTELTPNAVGIKYQLELDGTLAGQLSSLVADVPAANDNDDGMLAASLGVRVGRLRELLLEKATAMADAPFRCAKLAGLNKAANDALTQMNRPMPPFIGNLNGFRLNLDEIDFDDPSPATVRGMFALEVEKPQMLVGMAQMFVPGVEELGLEPGGDPVELPAELTSVNVDGMRVYAAMSKDSIGLALGADQQAGLAEFMGASADDAGTFFSLTYDMAAHMELQAKVQDHFGGMHAGHEETSSDFGVMEERIRSIQESYRDMLGRARLDLRFTSDGLEIESRMTFR